MQKYSLTTLSVSGHGDNACVSEWTTNLSSKEASEAVLSHLPPLPASLHRAIKSTLHLSWKSWGRSSGPSLYLPSLSTERGVFSETGKTGRPPDLKPLLGSNSCDHAVWVSGSHV